MASHLSPQQPSFLGIYVALVSLRERRGRKKRRKIRRRKKRQEEGDSKKRTQDLAKREYKI